MQSNQPNRTKYIKKIITAFGEIHPLPKALLKYGVYAFLGLLSIGSVMVLLNNTVLPYNSYHDMVSKEIVKTSFVIAAEVIIGSLAIDFHF
ncbi:MAG: hypothetical protein ACOX4M_08520 [Acetivibrionales bacterium]|jgi:hypothetical protein